MDNLYIVIPAYNESDNIEKTTQEWYSIVEKHNWNGKSRLIIIDDGSKDHTYDCLLYTSKKHLLLSHIDYQL